MTPLSRRARAEQWAPELRVLRIYQRAWLPKDLVAGLILSGLFILQGMAYAEYWGTSHRLLDSLPLSSACSPFGSLALLPA
jgi:hypothetical protein